MLLRYSVIALLCYSLLLPGSVGRAQQSILLRPFSQTSPAPSGGTPLQQSTAKNLSDPVERIKDESINRSQVMETLRYLTEVIGPRLTASPGMKRANEWTRNKLTEWGLTNVRLEMWGPFGRGWTLKRFSAQITEPQAIPLVAYPKAWSPGTRGPLTANVIYVDAVDEAALMKYKGKLKGAIVLMSPPREIKVSFDSLGRRLTEKELLALADATDPSLSPRFQPTAEQRAVGVLSAKKYQFFSEERVALVIEPSRAGEGGAGDAGTLFVQSATVPQPYYEYPFDARRIWPWEQKAPKMIPQIVVAAEQYNRMVRMIQYGEKLTMTIDLDVQFQDEDLMGYNTIAEIPGTDLKDEVVMLGGHLDSWHAGTGATDNGVGVAVTMEVMRILKALNLQPRRTIRLALWSGEEEGLRGSRAYVAAHFGIIGDGSQQAIMDAIRDARLPTNMRPKPEYEKLSVYFNLDSGTGKIRGVHLQGNEAARLIMRQWLIPFRDVGVTTVSISNLDGSDNLPFDALGLPSFQFIQDPVEYLTRTHHTNQDILDRILADDLKHNAAVMAAFVYNAAIADTKVPRKMAMTK